MQANRAVIDVETSYSGSVSGTLQEDLARQEHRRAQAIPTISLFAGPVGAALSVWRDWLAARESPLIACSVQDPGELLREIRFRSPPRNGRASRGRVRGGRSASLPRDPVDAVLDVLARWPGRHPPGVFVAHRSEGAAAESLLELGPFLARLASRKPALPLALCLPSSAVEIARASQPESHWWAILREGILTLDTSDGDQHVHRLAGKLAARDVSQLAPTVEQLATDGAGRSAWEALEQAALAAHLPAGELVFRSRAENLLYEWLQLQPETHGHFEPNVRVSCLPGNAARFMEVDLLARHMRIAIEVDGIFHFRDPDAYRKDRHRDIELQRQGYWVVRYLAEDITYRLSEVARSLLEVVSHRCRFERGKGDP